MGLFQRISFGLSMEGLELKMTQCLSLRSWGRWICSVLKVFSLWYTEDCIIKSRECLFLALRNFTEELLFKPVLKQKHELPAGQEQKGIRGGDSLSKDQEAFERLGGLLESLKEAVCRRGSQNPGEGR